MDLSFLRRAEQRFASQTAARPDFGMLVVMLRSQRRTGTSDGVRGGGATAPALLDPVVEILLAGPAWRRAVGAQGGSFNPRFARQRGVN